MVSCVLGSGPWICNDEVTSWAPVRRSGGQGFPRSGVGGGERRREAVALRSLEKEGGQ